MEIKEENILELNENNFIPYLEQFNLSIVAEVLDLMIKKKLVNPNSDKEKSDTYMKLKTFIKNSLWKDRYKRPASYYYKEFEQIFKIPYQKSYDELFKLNKSKIQPKEETIVYTCLKVFNQKGDYFLAITRQAFRLRTNTIYPTKLNFLMAKKMIDGLKFNTKIAS